MYAGVLACFSLLKEKDIYLPPKNANPVKFVEKRRKIIFLLKIFAYIRKKQYLCNRFGKEAFMVVLAQLAEHRIVVPSVVGSSPTFHPWFIARLLPRLNKNIPLGMFFVVIKIAV